MVRHVAALSFAFVACTGSISDVGAHERVEGSDGGARDAGTRDGGSRDDGGPAELDSGAPDAGASPRPVDLGVGIGVSAYHACVVGLDGAVVCWGNPQPRSTPPEGLHAIAIASGHLHNCVILPPESAERVLCFGFGGDTIVPPADLDPVQISVGQAISCTIERDDRVVCWGDDDTAPTPPEGLRAKLVSAAGAFSCAIDLDDRVVCWGAHPPELPESDLRALHLSVSQNEGIEGTYATFPRHACAVRLDHSVVCWGDDQRGEVSGVPADLRAREVAIGNGHACAIDLDRRVVCWGRPGGEVAMPSDLRARAIRLVHENGCVLPEDSDALVCWGRDDRRQASGPDGEAVYVPAD